MDIISFSKLPTNIGTYHYQKYKFFFIQLLAKTHDGKQTIGKPKDAPNLQTSHRYVNCIFMCHPNPKTNTRNKKTKALKKVICADPFTLTPKKKTHIARICKRHPDLNYTHNT